MASRTLASLIDPPEFDRAERYPPPSPVDNHFPEKPPKRESDYYCLGRGRWGQEHEYAGQWKYCYLRAGHGTSHTGFGRCMHHGGNAPSSERRYEAMLNPTISEKIAKFMLDPNPLDLRAELAAARALFEDMVERHEEVQEALLAWRASFERERRGLHDKPLYHIDAIQAALKGPLAERRTHQISSEQLHEALEQGVTIARQERMLRAVESGVNLRDDLKVERPTRVTDISHAARILKVVQELAGAIMKHEREAFLSIFAVEALIDYYAKATRRVVLRHLKRREVDDALEAADQIVKDIDREWQRAPVIENSVPRLARERREQDEYLGS